LQHTHTRRTLLVLPRTWLLLVRFTGIFAACTAPAHAQVHRAPHLQLQLFTLPLVLPVLVVLPGYPAFTRSTTPYALPRLFPTTVTPGSLPAHTRFTCLHAHYRLLPLHNTPRLRCCARFTAPRLHHTARSCTTCTFAYAWLYLHTAPVTRLAPLPHGCRTHLPHCLGWVHILPVHTAATARHGCRAAARRITYFAAENGLHTTYLTLRTPAPAPRAHFGFTPFLLYLHTAQVTLTPHPTARALPPHVAARRTPRTLPPPFRLPRSRALPTAHRIRTARTALPPRTATACLYLLTGAAMPIAASELFARPFQTYAPIALPYAAFTATILLRARILRRSFLHSTNLHTVT